MQEEKALLNDVFERHYPELVSWARSRVRNHLGDPEDFVHLAYLRCSRRWSADARSKHHEAAYLFRALRWVVLDALRREVRERSRQWPVARRDNGFPGCSIRELVAREAVMSLQGRQLEVCLALLSGQSVDDIRRDLDLSAGAVAVHLSRAKAALVRFLELDDRRSPTARRSGPTPSTKHREDSVIPPRNP